MNTDFVTAYNPDTGRAGKTPRRIVEHSVFGRHLVEVEDGEKSRVPSLHRSQTVEQYEATHPNLDTDEDVEVEQDVTYDPLLDTDESPKEK